MRTCFLFLAMIGIGNYFTIHLLYSNELQNKPSMKEVLSSQKGSKLYRNRSVASESKRLIRQYTVNFRETYNLSNFTYLYNSDIRQIGNSILELAIIYWIDKNSVHNDYLKDWCDRAIQIEDWGSNTDLEISHLLFALSIVYDLHKDTFDEEFQNRLKIFIYNHAKYQYEYAVQTQDRWWAGSYWQNHNWINYTSILASGMALSEDYEETSEWVTLAKSKIETVISVFSTDGSNHEGLNYSVYGNIWLVRALTLLEAFDKDIFNKCDYLKNYSTFYKAFSVDNRLNLFFDIGDSPQYLWYNPSEVFLKLYHTYRLDEYKDLYLFYLEKYKDIKPGLFSIVYGLLRDAHFKDTAVSKKPYYSEDLGIFVDKLYKKGKQKGKPSLSFLFKSGVPGGKTAHNLARQNSTYQLNLSHEHPDQNHFVVWNKNGFLISDTGYTYKKLTIDHNSLLVNGAGQLGEGEVWFKDDEVNYKDFSEEAGLTENGVYSTKDMSIVSADASEFYPESIGLKNFDRTIVWLKSVGFIVFDTIETETPQVLQLIFHSPFNIEKSGENECIFQDEGKTATYGRLISLYPAETNITVSKHDVISHPENEAKTIGEKISIERHMQNNHEDFMTLILPDSKERKNTFEEENENYRVRVDNGKRSFLALFKKDSSTSIGFGDYMINAKAAIVAYDYGRSKRITIFHGKSISLSGKVLWEVDGEQNRDFLFDENGNLVL